MKNYKKYIIASLLVVLAFCIGWQLSERTKIDINCPRCNYEIATNVPYIQYKWLWNIDKCSECGFILPVNDHTFDYKQYLEDREHYCSKDTENKKLSNY